MQMINNYGNRLFFFSADTADLSMKNPYLLKAAEK